MRKFPWRNKTACADVQPRADVLHFPVQALHQMFVLSDKYSAAALPMLTDTGIHLGHT
jgi:hypothetical protein